MCTALPFAAIAGRIEGPNVWDSSRVVESSHILILIGLVVLVVAFGILDTLLLACAKILRTAAELQEEWINFRIRMKRNRQRYQESISPAPSGQSCLPAKATPICGPAGDENSPSSPARPAPIHNAGD
jgi:hypothetical protein